MTSGGALLVALLSQSATEAAPAPVAARVRLDVRAATDCTSRSDLAARVAARSQRIELADDAPVSARVAVTSARPGNVIADLVFATAGVEQPPRRFDARSCAEAAEAVALIIAVTLDPTLARAAAPGAENDQAAATRAAPPPAVVAPEPAPAATPARCELGIYIAGQTIFGPAPAVMPGIALYAMAALDRDGAWAPALFVGATHVWRADLAAPNGTASFALDAASADACPLRLRYALFAARPCASVTVGRLTATGPDTDVATTSHRPFAAAGVALVASLGTTIQLSLRVGLGVTLLRDSYELGTTVFHRAGAITTSASLGIGVRWH